MRAAKPGCSSSQIKTQTPQTHCHVNIIPPSKILRYSILPSLCLFPPKLSPRGTAFSSLEGIAPAIPRRALCHYMPACGLKSDRLPPPSSRLHIKHSCRVGHNGQARVGVVHLKDLSRKHVAALIRPSAAHCCWDGPPLVSCPTAGQSVKT